MGLASVSSFFLSSVTEQKSEHFVNPGLVTFGLLEAVSLLEAEELISKELSSSHHRSSSSHSELKNFSAAAFSSSRSSITSSISEFLEDGKWPPTFEETPLYCSVTKWSETSSCSQSISKSLLPILQHLAPWSVLSCSSS